MHQRLNQSINYNLLSVMRKLVLKVISGCLLCLGCLAVFPAFKVGAEVFSNEQNPYILTETEDEYSICGIREYTMEYEMGSTSDCYVVIGSNDEYVFYCSNNNPPEGVTGFQETGLYTNDAQNTPVYTCPNAVFGGCAVIKKDGSEVWFVSGSKLNITTAYDDDLPVIEQYVNGALNNVVLLSDLRWKKADLPSPDNRYHDWYKEFRFSTDTIQITAPSGKLRLIDRQTGVVSFPEGENHSVREISLIAVCSLALILTMIFVLYKRKSK